MWGDEVLEDVRATREAHAARFGFDLAAILSDLRRRESTNGLDVVRPKSANGPIATEPDPSPRLDRPMLS
jgi:hypothetical protein